MHFVGAICFLGTETYVAFRAVAVLGFLRDVSVRDRRGNSCGARRNGVHSHVSVETDLFVGAVSAVRARVLLSDSRSLARVFDAVLIGLTAARFGSAQRFRIVGVVRGFIDSMRTIVSPVGFQGAERRESYSAGSAEVKVDGGLSV